MPRIAIIFSVRQIDKIKPAQWWEVAVEGPEATLTSYNQIVRFPPHGRLMSLELAAIAGIVGIPGSKRAAVTF
jgi:hypothetical protein